MGSLTTCLKKAGDLLDSSDRKAIIARARAIRASGVPSAEASRRAVEERMAEVQAMIDNAPEPAPRGRTAPVAAPEARELTPAQAAVAKPSRKERMLGELLEQATDEEVRKDLTKQIEAERDRRVKEARGEEYLRLADAAEDPALRRDLEAKAAKLGVTRAVPAPEAVEMPVAEVIEVGESIEIDEADWRAANLLGAQDAERAKSLARALRIDPEAAEAAATQFNNQPRALDRAIEEIIARKEAQDANERQGAAEGGEGLQPAAGRGEGGQEAGRGSDQQGQGAPAESARRAGLEDAGALQREAEEPSGFGSPRDAAEQRQVEGDLRELDRIRSRMGERSRTELVPPQDVHAAFARNVAESFRAPIFFVRNTAGESGWNAFTAESGNVYINVDADAPSVALAMHEVGHNLPADIKADMIDAVMQTVTPEQRAAFLREFPNYRSLDAAKQDEELVMRVIEQDAQNPAFWDAMAQRLGDTRFGRVARSILNALDRILSGFAKEDSSEFTSNIKAVRKAVADAFAMAEARQRMGGGMQFSGRRGRDAGDTLAQEANDGRQREGNRAGRPQRGSLAPLDGAPSVSGASGPDEGLVAAAEEYAREAGIPYRRQERYVEVDPERATRIADAYDKMPHAPDNPAVRAAYEDLIRQTVAQYRALERAGYRFYFFDETNDPYDGNPWNAMRDLRANKTMGVFASEAGFGSGATDLDTRNNPLLADTGIQWPYGGLDGQRKRVLANDLFRAVHDAFGHGLEGAGFRARGEENAWQAHARLFTGPALGALTSETRGQNSWLNYGPYGEANRNAKVEDTVFADQKTGLMPEWTWREGLDGAQFSERRRSDVSPLGFYSQLARSIESGPGKGSAQAWEDYIRGQQSKGVKADEVEWSGVNEWLDMQQGPITRDALAEFVRGNGVRVEEVAIGQPKRNERSKYLTREVRRVLQEASGQARDNISLQLANDGDAYRELTRKFPELADDEDWYETVLQDILGDERRNETKYGQYVVPGGSNYREVLLTLPVNKPTDAQIEEFAKRWLQSEFDRKGDRFADSQERIDVMKDDVWAWNDLWSQAAIKEFGLESAYVLQPQRMGYSVLPKTAYRSSHWDQPNVLAHFRVDDRTDADGKRVLFVNEIQSDWGQTGKKDGFADRFGPDTHEVVPAPISSRDTAISGFGIARKGDEGRTIIDGVYSSRSAAQAALEAGGTGSGPPRAPFVGKTDAWVSLALKRIIKMAADEGYDRVAFINGQQAADLYDLSKQVGSVRWASKPGAETGKLTVKDLNGNTVLRERTADPLKASELEDFVGKDVARKLIEAPPKTTTPYGDEIRELAGLDLKVGGEGMRAFYGDTEIGRKAIVDASASSLAKKIGGNPVSWRPEPFIPVIKSGGKWYVQRVNGEPGAGPYDTKEQAQTIGSLDITPAMREKVAGGLPLFSERRKRDVTETPEFKRWFGDSKVVDAEGKPLVVYHGTNADINRFETRQKTGRKSFYPGELGSWFGSKPGVANVFAGKPGGAVYPVYLSIRRPKVFASYVQFLDVVDGLRSASAYRAELERQGFDGVLILNSTTDFGGPRSDWVAFRPEQIKSATGNRGTFDPADPDIRMSERRKRDVTDTPEFKRWFSGSKVVDADGKPLVVYHGTGRAMRGGAFNPDLAMSEGGGFYFSHSPLMKNPATNANDYAANRSGDAANVMPVYLRMKNPLIVGFTEPMPEGDKAIGAWLDRMQKFNRSIDMTKERYYKQAIRDALAGGHDGVIVRNVEDVANDAGRRFTDEADVYIAFTPEQIKSAIGNRGTFDPANPDIRMSERRRPANPDSTPSAKSAGKIPEPARKPLLLAKR